MKYHENMHYVFATLAALGCKKKTTDKHYIEVMSQMSRSVKGVYRNLS